MLEYEKESEKILMSVKGAEPEPGKQWKHDTEAGQDSHVTFPVLGRKPSGHNPGLIACVYGTEGSLTPTSHHMKF